MQNGSSCTIGLTLLHPFIKYVVNLSKLWFYGYTSLTNIGHARTWTIANVAFRSN